MSISQPKLLQCQSRSQLASLLGIDVTTLNYYAYSNSKKYKQFQIAKKSGGTRTISAPVGGLNMVQKRLAGYLEEVYNTHPAAHGFIPSRSIVTNASLHLRKKGVLNIDLKDFFPAITTGRIIGLLKSEHFKLNNEVASAIASLCTNNDQLPQGAATSPIISNMICYRLDRQLTTLCRKERVTYTRYADDITFSTTRKEFSQTYIKLINDREIFLGDTLQAIIGANYFEVNQSKVRLHTGTNAKYVTGIKVNLKPNLTQAYIRQLRSMIHSWERHGLDNAQLMFDTKYGGGGRSLRSVVLGKLAHLKQVKGRDDLVYRRLYNKVMILEGKYDRILPTTEVEDILNRIFVVKSGEQFGTGFILDGKWLITCAHVIAEDDVTFFSYQNARLPDEYHHTKKKAEWFSPVSEYDIAALPINTEIINDLNTLKSAPTTVEVRTGDTCRVVGFPKYYIGATPSLTDVKVTKIEANKYGIDDAHVDRTLVSGNSGGPVVNSHNEVVGIVRTGAPDKDDNQGFGSTFLPIQEIRRCLERF